MHMLSSQVLLDWNPLRPVQGPPNGQQGPPQGQQAPPNGQQQAAPSNNPLANYKPLINVNPVLHINGFKHYAELAGGSISLPGGVTIPIPKGIEVCAQSPNCHHDLHSHLYAVLTGAA